MNYYDRRKFFVAFASSLCRISHFHRSLLVMVWWTHLSLSGILMYVRYFLVIFLIFFVCLSWLAHLILAFTRLWIEKWFIKRISLVLACQRVLRSLWFPPIQKELLSTMLSKRIWILIRYCKNSNPNCLLIWFFRFVWFAKKILPFNTFSKQFFKWLLYLNKFKSKN